MRFIREASFEEFVRWYLVRERRKRRQNDDVERRPWDRLMVEMLRSHPSKLRPWFARARWTVALLDSLDEARALVCVDSWETRRSRLVANVGPDRRTARTLVARARSTVYFDNASVIGSNAVEAHFRQERIDAFRRHWPELRDADRLTICDLNPEEQAEAPDGTHYLHDGLGRLLPYLYLIAYEDYPYRPIEVFTAQFDASA